METVMRSNYCLPFLLRILFLSCLFNQYLQAQDIKPLHHVCDAGSPLHFSGSLGSGTAADIIRFTCPAGISGSFEFSIRDKNSPDVLTDARASFGTSPTTIDFVSGNPAFSNQVVTNTNGPYDIRVDKVLGIAPVNYELCIRCYQGDNEAGSLANPVSRVYLQNQ
jgi:hypothetical protein